MLPRKNASSKEASKGGSIQREQVNRDVNTLSGGGCHHPKCACDSRWKGTLQEASITRTPR
jgi:hypothetical protein